MMTEDSSVDVSVDLFDPEEEIRPQRHSFIRLSAAEPSNDGPETQEDLAYSEPPTLRTAAPILREILANDQLNLTVNVLHLRRLVDGEPGNPSAPRAIADRVGELEDVRDALESLLSVRDERAAHLMAPGGPFAAYLKGLYLFCEGVADAFEDALTATGSAGHGLISLNWRLAQASQFFFDGLTEAVQNELQRARPREARELDHQIDELFFAAAFLYAQIARAFR